MSVHTVLCVLFTCADVLPLVAELKAEAARVESEADLGCQTQAREAEVTFIREQNQLEVTKAKELSNIEVRIIAY